MLQFLEPTNCVKTPMNQILWAALDTVMQVGHDFKVKRTVFEYSLISLLYCSK